MVDLAGAGRLALARAHEWDAAAYRVVATTSTPLLDEPLRRISQAANYSRISMGAAALLAAGGGARGRRAAMTGIASIAVASASVNLGAKLMTRRERPDRASHGVVPDRHVPMPESTSFPSGHSAAAFAFATGVRHEWPRASIPLYALAAVVAYSRVHTGVHYPGDVAVGSAMGIASAVIAGRVSDSVRRRAAN